MRRILIAVSLCLSTIAAARAGEVQDAMEKALNAEDYQTVLVLADQELAKTGLSIDEEVQLHGARSLAEMALGKDKGAIGDIEFLISHVDTGKLENKADFANFYALLGTAHADLGQREEAVSGFEHAIAMNPDNVDFYKSLGDVFYGWGRTDEAIANYSEAVKRDPNDAEALANRGENYQNKREFEKAVADYTQAIRAKPDFAMAINDRGTALSMLKRYDEARADYDKSIALAPEKGIFLINRAGLHNDLGEWQPAIDDLDKAAALTADPDLRKAIDEARKTAQDGLAKKTP